MNEEYWLQNAKPLAELKENPLFVCFSTSLLQRAFTKELLKGAIESHIDLSIIAALNDKYVAYLQYGDPQDYPDLRITTIVYTLIGGGSDDPLFKRFISDASALHAYLVSVRHPDSAREFETYWDYLHSLIQHA